MNMAAHALLLSLLPSIPVGRPNCAKRMLLLAVLGLFLSLASPVAAQQSVWEFTPYRIHVFLGWGRAPELSPQLQADLMTALTERSSAVVGAAWDLTVTTAPPALRRALTTGLETITVDQLPSESLEGDKVLLMTVMPNVTGYEVAARELDVHTQTWNTTVRQTVWQSAKLGEGLSRVARSAFAPLAHIVEVDKKRATLRLRAAALPTRDQSFQLVKPGDLFQPMYRYNDREGKARRITTIPFTFLAVEKVGEADVGCRLYSGMRSPLSGRRRGRVEQLALRIAPPRAATTLTLQSRVDTKQVLPGYDIYESTEGAQPAKWLGRTDWRGTLRIPPAASPLRILLVRSGGELLARLPIVPGMHDALTAPMPDNSQKLRAEGFLKGFQEDLIDLVTRREMLLAQARSRLQTQRWKEAQELLEKLRLLKTRADLGRQLDQEMKKLTSSDPFVQRDLEAMFAETRKLLATHLAPGEVERLATAIRENREGKAAERSP